MGSNEVVSGLQAVPSFATCDLCDAHRSKVGAGLRVLPGVLRDFGAVRRFAGPVQTVRCYEDNSAVKAAVESAGWVDLPTGRWARVLVVDGGASLRRSLVGDLLAAAAVRNGWAAVLVEGAVRDVQALSALPLGIRALSSVPLPTDRKGEGQTGLPVRFLGEWVRPGDWLYADEDGVVVSDVPLL